LNPSRSKRFLCSPNLFSRY